MCTAVLIGWEWDPSTPPLPTRFWTHIRGRWSAKIDDISLWPPVFTHGSFNKDPPLYKCLLRFQTVVPDTNKYNFFLFPFLILRPLYSQSLVQSRSFRKTGGRILQKISQFYSFQMVHKIAEKQVSGIVLNAFQMQLTDESLIFYVTIWCEYYCSINSEIAWKWPYLDLETN